MRTLFDCDTCEAARDRIADLEAENRWLRRHVAGQLRLRVITHLQLVIEHPDGDTTIRCHRGEHPLTIEHWAEAWTATGVINAAQRGGGVACRGEAVRFVVDQLDHR